MVTKLVQVTLVFLVLVFFATNMDGCKSGGGGRKRFRFEKNGVILLPDKEILLPDKETLRMAIRKNNHSISCFLRNFTASERAKYFPKEVRRLG